MLHLHHHQTERSHKLFYSLVSTAVLQKSHSQTKTWKQKRLVIKKQLLKCTLQLRVEEGGAMATKRKKGKTRLGDPVKVDGRQACPGCSHRDKHSSLRQRLRTLSALCPLNLETHQESVTAGVQRTIQEVD